MVMRPLPHNHKEQAMYALNRSTVSICLDDLRDLCSDSIDRQNLIHQHQQIISDSGDLQRKCAENDQARADSKHFAEKVVAETDHSISKVLVGCVELRKYLAACRKSQQVSRMRLIHDLESFERLLDAARSTLHIL